MTDLLAFVADHGYLLIFLFVFAEQVGLPLPALPVLLAGGALARTDALSLPLVFAVCLAGSLLSDVLWYEIGRRHGMKVMRLLCRMSLEPDSCVRRTEESFARQGARSLLIAKFVPGLSTAAPPMAGVFGMRRGRFLFYDTLGTAAWAGAFVGLGWIFADALEEVIEWAAALGGWALALLAGLLAVYVLVKYWQRRRFLRQLRIDRLTPEELRGRLDAGEDMVVVDLRHSKDFELDPDSIPGAWHLPVEEVEAHEGELPFDREIVLLCT